MSEDRKTKPLILQGDRLYPTRISTQKDLVTDLSVIRDHSLERSNERSNRQIQQLREQAQILMEHADAVEFEANIQVKIREAECRFIPVVHKGYFLYEKNGHCFLSLVGPNEWKGQSPYGTCLACVMQLEDLTWEISDQKLLVKQWPSAIIKNLKRRLIWNK